MMSYMWSGAIQVGSAVLLVGLLLLMAAALIVIWALVTTRRAMAQIRRVNVELGHKAAVAQAILDNIADGISVIDAAGNLTFNPAAERIMGTKAVPGGFAKWIRTFGLFLPDMTTPYPQDDLPMARALRGETVREALMFVRPPGAFDGIWLSGSSSPLRIDGKLAGGISIYRDVTAARRNEEAVRTLNAELQQRIAERDATNKELEAFTYSVSHDLRAPLRAIHGFVRILIEDYGDEIRGEARRYLDLVAANAQHMGRLVDDLLRFSRLGRQPIRNELVDTQALVHRAVDQLQPALDGREIELTVGELPPCQGDPILLEQVFVNLIGNAVKYTQGRTPARIEIGSRRGEDGRPVYFVKDNGAGFDMQYAHKLFEVFQRLHRSEDYEGTGVGLAIVHRIVTRHGGRVWAEAELDKGATFFFTLGGDPEWQAMAA